MLAAFYLALHIKKQCLIHPPNITETDRNMPRRQLGYTGDSFTYIVSYQETAGTTLERLPNKQNRDMLTLQNLDIQFCSRFMEERGRKLRNWKSRLITFSFDLTSNHSSIMCMYEGKLKGKSYF